MKLKTLSALVANTGFTRDTLSGVPHLVIPTVAAKVGVMNGIFYSAEVLQAFVEAWNGVPVPLNHPTDSQGDFLSANNKETLEEYKIGVVLNARFEDNKLKVDLWIEEARANELDPDIVANFDSGQMMEVSTGMFLNAILEDGEFEGASFNAIATELRPDHIAVLNNEVGACSIAGGCGALRTNCGGEKKTCSCGGKCGGKKPKTNAPKTTARIISFVKGLFSNNEDSHDEIYRKLASKLRGELGEDPWPYILSVYSDTFVYEISGELYRQSYAVDSESGDVTFLSDRVRVRMVTEYVPLTNNQKQNMKRKEVVTNLIANAKGGGFEEGHRANLEGLPDEAFGQLLSANGLNEQGLLKTAAAPAAPDVNPTPAAPAVNSALSAEDREALDAAKQIVAANKAKVDGKRAQLTAANATFTPEIVANMNEAAIDAALQSFGPSPVGGSADYSGAAGSVPSMAGNSGDENLETDHSGLFGNAGEEKPREEAK